MSQEGRIVALAQAVAADIKNLQEQRGTVVLDFGASPGANEAYADVIDQAAITATAHVDAFVAGNSSTSDHTNSDHRYFPQLCSLVCGTPDAGSGFRVYARSIHKLTGTWLISWIWKI